MYIDLNNDTCVLCANTMHCILLNSTFMEILSIRLKHPKGKILRTTINSHHLYEEN